MAEAEAADETDQTPASPPGLGFSSPALHAAAQVAVIAAHGDELEDGAGELASGDALQLELDADEEEGAPRGNGGDADQVGADTEPAALDGGDGAVLCFGSPPSSPSPAIVLGGEESSAISSHASSPQAGPGLGRRLLGAIGLASPSKPPGVIHRAKLGLGLVLHQEEGAAHHRDNKEEEMVHKCSDANWSTTDEASALEGQVEEESTVGEINAERGATKGKFTVENRKEVVERARHEWGATEDDLAVDTAASGGVSGISSSDVVSVSINGSDGETVKKEKVKLCVRYPQRPGKLNGPFYMSTGCYSYGLSCHFNHPPLQANSDVSSVPSEQGNHGVAEILELNRVGLPIREGARNCTFYMRNGTCRYGKKCHYNHPEQVIDAQLYPPTGWEDNVLPSSPHLKKSSDHATLDDTSYLKKSSDDATLDDTSYSKRSSDHATLDGTSYSKKSSDHATLDNTSSSSEVLPPNILRMLLPPQKVPPSTEGKVTKVKKDPDWSSASDDSDGCCSADSSDGPLCKQEHVDYPERPGRPECPFYMRFGDCKFASACKYHHSKDRFPCRYHSKDPLLGEELIEYPERPGEPECPFYMKSRFCKFGAECKFQHPKDLTPSRRNPTTTKKSVAAANEHHPAIRITLKDHICPQQQHPERPGQPDCRYYMQFGKCKYLSACIFHHPKDRLPSGWHPSDPAHSDQYDTWQPTNRIEDLCQQAQIGPEIPGMPECPFYMKTGTCQFGSLCEFRHPKDRCSTTEEAIDQGTDLAYHNFTRSDNVPQLQEQTMYPERPGEPECSYYMRHGSCKFQMNCKYHHPRDRLSKKPYGSSTYH